MNSSRESWALEYADYEIEYRDGICFTELEEDLKDMLACQLCCPRHQKGKPNLDDLKAMFDGAYPRCEKVELPYVCRCPCRSNARVICENNVGEYEHLVSMINDAPFKIRLKNEFMRLGKEKKAEFYDRELPYVIYHRSNMICNGVATDRYGYLVRYNDKVYDLIIHSGHEWTLEEAAIVERETLYTTFDGQERRVLKYVDFKVDSFDEKKLAGYFGSDHLYYRRELEQMLSCDSCCARHQIKKPCLTDLDNLFDGIYEDGPGDDCECDCNCRSSARQLCWNNVAKYNMLKGLMNFEIKTTRKNDYVLDNNVPYLIYNEYDDSAPDDVSNWVMYFDILIRINGVVYDIQVCHSSDEKNGTLKLVRAAMVE